MKFRLERINSEMLKSISEIIRNKVKDPRVSEMVSVTKVVTAKDLRTAKVYVSIYGDSEKIKSTFDALKQCEGFIHHELGVEFKQLRVVPRLTFIADETEEYGRHIDLLLKEIKSDDADRSD